MPVMIRSNNKATKIAYKLLGVPANIKHDKNATKNADQLKAINRPYFYGWAR